MPPLLPPFQNAHTSPHILDLSGEVRSKVTLLDAPYSKQNHNARDERHHLSQRHGLEPLICVSFQDMARTSCGMDANCEGRQCMLRGRADKQGNIRSVNDDLREKVCNAEGSGLL